MTACVPVKLEGLGVYLPSSVVLSSDLERAWGLRAGMLLRMTGVESRRHETSKTSAEMAACAASAALVDAGMTAADLGAIIGGSAIPQQVIPCMSALVQRELGDADGVFCFDVNATCLGFLAALHVASLMIQAGQVRSSLVYSSEQTSLSLNPEEWESAGLFGDAAVAVVLGRTAPGESSCLSATRFETYSDGAHLTTLRGGGTFRHPNDPRTAPVDNLFHMAGPAVMTFASQHFGRFLDSFLNDTGRSRCDYDVVVPHQASRSALNLLTSRYGFSSDQIVSNLRDRGNCIAASIPLALAEAVRVGRITRGDRVLMVGTAAGLSLGAIDMVF